MRIAVDVMGGDYAPHELVAGAVKWIQENDSQVVLVGKEDVIKAELTKYVFDPSRLSIVNASEVIGMEESPATAIRRKKDASIVVASKLVKNEQADALISCGSTGAQMAAAIFILGRMEGIERPPIVASIPNMNGKNTLLIDVGANVDCKAKQLLQFAILGKTYASISGIANPRVALLNNGEEESKGNSLSIETHSLLKHQPDLYFVGNIEGREMFGNSCDVVVCDGFTGNIVLKTMEGMAMFLARLITMEIGQMPSIFNKLDYTKAGGAPLLGINGVSIVCHGSSKQEALYNGIRIAEECVNREMVKLQQEELAKII
ncbi:MAG: phosphate acyltransferase PlsX [Syntrophomonadaceae bacterium]|nr:phosphate acyltransferase PlsX [Syntrophomonadaceae bacterium]MDD3022680.1 phosphate acyltransferase PlsX [Syntrophomonadaceae bacterium]